MRGFPSRFHGPLSSFSASVWSLVLSGGGGRRGLTVLTFSPCHRRETKAQKGHRECTGSYQLGAEPRPRGSGAW